MVNPLVPGNIDVISTFRVASNGVLILTTFRRDYRNYSHSVPELWSSLDGGYTWGQCLQKATFNAREGAGLILDAKGYPYILGGLSATDTEIYSDVWRASLSVFDVKSWSQACRLPLPPKGVGLAKVNRWTHKGTTDRARKN